jgi:hypothetical protein
MTLWHQSALIDWAGVAFAFKLLWIIAILAVYYEMKSNMRIACFIVSGYILAIAATYIGVDYTRIVGFAMLPMMFSYRTSIDHLTPRFRKLLSAANIIVPSVRVNGNVGYHLAHGAYVFIARWLFRISVPLIGRS